MQQGSRSSLTRFVALLATACATPHASIQKPPGATRLTSTSTFLLKQGTDGEDWILAIAFDVNLAHEVFISPIVADQATLDDPVWRVTPFLKAAFGGVRS
jgi:hypothetical protein